ALRVRTDNQLDYTALVFDMLYLLPRYERLRKEKVPSADNQKKLDAIIEALFEILCTDNGIFLRRRFLERITELGPLNLSMAEKERYADLIEGTRQSLAQDFRRFDPNLEEPSPLRVSLHQPHDFLQISILHALFFPPGNRLLYRPQIFASHWKNIQGEGLIYASLMSISRITTTHFLPGASPLTMAGDPQLQFDNLQH